MANRDAADVITGIVATIIGVMLLFITFWAGQMSREISIKDECDAYGQTRLSKAGIPSVTYVCKAKV